MYTTTHNLNNEELTPCEAESMEWRFGMESALSIFTITCISALCPTEKIYNLVLKRISIARKKKRAYQIHTPG